MYIQAKIIDRNQTIIKQQIPQSPKLKKYMNIQTHNQREQQNNEYDDMFSFWHQNSNTNKEAFGFVNSYFDQNSIINGSRLSLKSMNQNNPSQQQIEAHLQRISGNTPNTISLTDMLGTNCSHIEFKNSMGGMEGEKNSALNQRTNNRLYQEYTDYGLEEVSNRRLQNRLNSRRARQRRKQQWEQMKEIINQLQLQNKTLRQSLQSKTGMQEQDNKRIKKNWKFCKRCQRQIFYQRNSQQDSEQNSKSDSLVQHQHQKQPQYFQLKRTKPSPQKIPKQKQNQGSVNRNFGKQMQIQKQKQRGNQVQMQFQQIDFNVRPKVCKQAIKQRQRLAGQGKRKNQKWVGKIWIGLSIIMLVIGVQLYGFQGAGQKCIRVHEQQIKKWSSQFLDPSTQSLKIRLKTKSPTSPPIPEKPNPHHQYAYKQATNFKARRSANTNRNSDRSRSGINSNSNWLDSISFESEEMYSRQLIQEEQETELQIDKDLLFSIQAEIDDIGRYI